MEEIRCKECVFRGKPGKNMCDYAWLVGHTRKAQPAEKCTYFIAGGKLETPEAAAEFLGKRKAPGAEEVQRKPEKPGRKKVNWERAEELYRTGANDGEIAREIGVSPPTVCNWRRRNQLPANATSGGRHGEKNTHRNQATRLRWGEDEQRSKGYGAREDADRTGQDRTGQAAEPAREEKRAMKQETRDRIRKMLREDADYRKKELDRVLIQGGDGKRELEEYREALLAREDFEEEGAEENAVG